MKAVRLSLCLVFGLCFLVSCVESPKVVQGKVQSYQADSKILVVADEKAPGTELTISLASAEVGAEPAPGDLVRVSFREPAGQAVAIRVMNLTKQKDSGQSGH